VICTGLWIRIDLMQIQIRIQHFSNCGSGSIFRFGSGSGPSSGCRVSINKNLKIFNIFFRSKNAIHLCLGLHKGRSSYRRSPQRRTSSTSKHEKSLPLSIFGDHFCPPGSGSGSSSSNYCGSRSGSTTLDLHHVCCRV
jgi:hypothetical protein